MHIITEHFDASEFAQPARHGFESEAYPLKWIDSRLRPLCEQLENIRDKAGPLTILSGYRSEAYNRKIGGAKASQHVQGRAADIVCKQGAKWLHALVLGLYESGQIKIGGLGFYPQGNFVHVDIRPGTLKRWTGSRSG
jgi:uncharacterized protein YcbK (DUF882 family)